MLIGRYGFGVHAFGMAINAMARAHRRSATRNIQRHTAPLPQVAVAPTASQLAALCRMVESASLPPASSIASVIPICADWRTQGSWLGHYGRFWRCLFAADDPGIGDMVWGPGPQGLFHDAFIGPHCRPGDSIRFYQTWLFTHKRRVLQLPPIYDQVAYATGIGGSDRNDNRESEIDDHGEAYISTVHGPDVNVTLHIPKGEYTLSLYEFNKDGHDGANRDRDYIILAEVLPPGTSVQSILFRHGSTPFY